jgi:hypothetical protein
MQIKIEDFEKCLECWKTLYRLDDGIYKIILGGSTAARQNIAFSK